MFDKPLLVRQTPVEDESPAGYVLRVAGDLKYSYASLCRFLQVTRHDLACQNAQAARKLHLTEPEWHSLTYGVLKAGRFLKRLLRGHVVNADRLCISWPRVCGYCLRQSPHCRWYWDLNLYCYCHIHSCEMVSICWTCSRAIRWSRISPSVCGCGTSLTTTTAARATTGAIIASTLIIKAVQSVDSIEIGNLRFPNPGLNSVLELLMFLGQLSSSALTSDVKPTSALKFSRVLAANAGRDLGVMARKLPVFDGHPERSQEPRRPESNARPVRR
jgi:hypothetical protein